MYSGIQWQPLSTHWCYNSQVRSFTSKPSSIHQSAAFAWITLQSFIWKIFLVVQIYGYSRADMWEWMIGKKSIFFLRFSLGQVGGYVVPFLEGCCKTCKWLMTLAASQVCLICSFLRNKVDCFLHESLMHWSWKAVLFPVSLMLKSEWSSLTLKGLLHW